MAFHNIQFPTDKFNIGSTVGTGFRTSIVEMDSGQEERFGRFSQPRTVFDLSVDTQNFSQINTLLTFVMARKGALHSFRLKNPLDFTSASDGTSTLAATDQTIGAGDGTTTQFQLVKTYTDSGSFTQTKNITKPVSTTTAVAVNGSTSTADGLGWTVDTSSGVVTFTTAPAASAVVTAGFDFDYHVRFEEESDQAMRVGFSTTTYGDFSSVRMIEVLSPEEVAEEYEPGGSKDHGTISADNDISLSLTDGVFHLVDDDFGVDSNLPDPTRYPTGPQIFVVRNEGSSNHEVRTHEDVALVTLTGGSDETAIIGLVEDDAGTKTRKAFKA